MAAGDLDFLAADIFDLSGLTRGALKTTLAACFNFSGYATCRLDIAQHIITTILSIAHYGMRAWDEDGSQYVYWETDDPSAIPIATYPTAIGLLSRKTIISSYSSS